MGWKRIIAAILTLDLTVASIIVVRARLLLDRALDWPPPEQVRFPETIWRSYGQDELRSFVTALGGPSDPHLRTYIDDILRFSDLWFAVALAAFSAFVCYWIWTLRKRFLSKPALLLGASALVYGVSDLAEDTLLAKILEDVDHADPAEIATASLMTQIKIGSLVLSGVGAVTFLVIHSVQNGVATLMKPS